MDELSRGLIQWHEPEGFIYVPSERTPQDQIVAALRYIRAKYWPRVVCVHCGIESTAPDRHICEAAIMDWVWADAARPEPIDNQRLADQMWFRQANPVSGLENA